MALETGPVLIGMVRDPVLLHNHREQRFQEQLRLDGSSDGFR